MSYIVTSEWVSKRLEETDSNLIIVDCRFELQSPEVGKRLFIENHLPTAVYLDLNKDLSGPTQQHGGNHPLPDMHEFAEKLGNLGIDEKTTVVVYDQANEMYAPRLWWLLTYMGHEDVYILDGGYEKWVAEGRTVTQEIVTRTPKVFTPHIQTDAKVDIEGVKEKLGNQSAILIDSRAKDRYLGKVEPLYARAGHIPGAKNYFFKGVLKDNGLWKNTQEMEVHFADLPKNKEIIVSCGSGVSACPNIIALKQAGYTNVKLYPGSYSDWISYEENEVETMEE